MRRRAKQAHRQKETSRHEEKQAAKGRINNGQARPGQRTTMTQHPATVVL